MSTVYSPNVKNEITLLHHPKIQSFSENPSEKPVTFFLKVFFRKFSTCPRVLSRMQKTASRWRLPFRSYYTPFHSSSILKWIVVINTSRYG